MVQSVRVPALSVLLAAGMACNSSTPTTPGGPTGTCRTYPTAIVVATAPQTVLQNATIVRNFNSSNNQLTTTTSVAGGALCATSVSTYSSRADFIDEVKTIPPVRLLTSNATANTGLCGSGAPVTTYVYDAQRRLIQAQVSGAGTTIYTAWDSAGRPTTGSITTGGTVSKLYTDAARTEAETQNAGGTTTVTTTTYDANGAVVSVFNASTGQSTTYSNTSIATVCK